MKDDEKPVERNVDYLIGEINGTTTLHVGRGYFNGRGKYKKTLSILVDPASATSVLSEQLLRYEVLYAIDTNNKSHGDINFTLSCAVHISIEHVMDGNWRNGVFTRLPAVLALASQEKPELIAWRRLIEFVSPRINGRIGLVVDSELGDIPLFNTRVKAIHEDYFLPDNVELIYASSERDSSSPLNKAISICDSDANHLAKKIINLFSPDILSKSILSSENECIYLTPSSSI